MRTHAYVVPSEVYREVETQILEQLREVTREQLGYLLGDADMEVELLSGEWRALFEACADYYQFVDDDERQFRMAVSPDELAEFVEVLTSNRSKWAPISFGIEELIDVLPANMDLFGVVIVEEGDDFLWTESPYEIMAIRPEVWSLIEPQVHKLIAVGDHAALARLCGDHAEASVEFSTTRWETFMAHTRERVPELLPVINGVVTKPADYTGVREAIGVVSDPAYQPSLDAWLRVHADASNYALFFRDVRRERD